jgi:hypothetical protein
MGRQKEGGEEAMSRWYVSYRSGGTTVISIAKSRGKAISTAWEMLGRGIDVQEIGPLLGMRDGNVIGSGEIRKMHAMRAHELVGSP